MWSPTEDGSQGTQIINDLPEHEWRRSVARCVSRFLLYYLSDISFSSLHCVSRVGGKDLRGSDKVDVSPHGEWREDVDVRQRGVGCTGRGWRTRPRCAQSTAAALRTIIISAARRVSGWLSQERPTPGQSPSCVQAQYPGPTNVLGLQGHNKVRSSRLAGEVEHIPFHNSA
jgi:hypothetical protein